MRWTADRRLMMRCAVRRLGSIAVVLVCYCLSSAALGQDSDAEQPFGHAEDACRHPAVTDSEADPKPMLDRMQGRLYRTVCVSARWFDGLFGTDLPFLAGEEIYGRLRLGAEWTEFEGFDPKLRLRANIPLPNVSQRLNAFVGRVDEETYIRGQDTPASGGFAEGFESAEPEWLLGLGYRGASGRRHNLDWSAGVRIRTPLNPYIKGKYAYLLPRGDDFLLRFDETVFWENDDGFGSTSHLSIEQTLNPDFLLRWEAIGTVSEGIDGLEWWTGTTLYQNLNRRRAIAWLAFIRGETDEPVELREYGFRATYRRPISRDYLFLELGPEITWPRERLDQDREMSLGFAVIVEMQFGDFRY